MSHNTRLATRFTVFPAIDLRNGHVVRLAQGDPARQTTYADDPVAVSQRWKSGGAAWLHVVNLDGAFDQDARTNVSALAAITAVGLKVQFGGGLRDAESLRRALELGVSRAVIGTAAIESPALVEWAVREFGPEKIAVGIDAHLGQVRIRGWTQESGIAAIASGKRLREQGVTWCVFTDVARDGVGTGVNVTATVELARETGLRVIASGGVAGMDDVRRVRQAGLAGIVIGRALYEGQVSLEEALADDPDRGL